ncbi:hypothetical protein MACJ_002921 [Theileria orientalis]|uniref:Uncharacterized protein n=1 Tax=Theileria orientalis TaxID=68886 RepID=A0A976QQU7_THEOR|nr:hypothetical protein MACJ_002921 [Theileria orientalis]
MKGLYKFLVLIYICTRSCVAINNHKDNSFLSLLSNDKNFSPASEPESPEEAPEKPPKPSQKTTIEKIKGLFKNEDKVSTKRQNNVMAMEFESYKNVRNKKVVDVKHLQVQKSNSMFTNNTDKGVMHFTSDMGKMSNKGTVTRATLKLTKLFDGKNFGFACKSNAVNLFLIEAPTEEMKLKVVKGPIRLEFKRDEMEFDITKFFENLDDNAAPGPDAPANLSGASTLLQFTDLSSNDEDLGFDEENAPGSGEGEEDFLDENRNSGDESEADSAAAKGPFEKYLMLEADDSCYFGFDVDKKKPTLKIEFSKKVVNRTKGKYKAASFTFLGVSCLALIGVVGYML